MMLELLFLLPFAAGIAMFFLPGRLSRYLLPLVAGCHLGLVVLGCQARLEPWATMYFGLAGEGMLVLLVTSFVFFVISIYGITYVEETGIGSRKVYYGCMMLFLGTMSMVALSIQPIVLWIAVEATTLVSAPLIYIHRSKEALEATWKYVLICSVGIGLALLGCFFISLSMDIQNLAGGLDFQSLNRIATELDPILLKVGFIFAVIGFGTKMGLAPMHTWLPDAHSQAPSPASAMLSGALLNCAFLGIYKIHILMNMAGLGDFSSKVLIGFGLLSILVSAIFIMNQPDYKRMLAYSSVENMGIIAVGVGAGGVGLYGAMLHLIHHSLIKSSLFLSAGNILLGLGSKEIRRAAGLIDRMPASFVSFFAGFVGIAGLPPFGTFISEMIIVFGLFQQGEYLVASLFLSFLGLVFAGSAKGFMVMAFEPGEGEIKRPVSFLRLASPCLLLLVSILLCVWMPDILTETISDSVKILGGTFHG